MLWPRKQMICKWYLTHFSMLPLQTPQSLYRLKKSGLNALQVFKTQDYKVKSPVKSEYCLNRFLKKCIINLHIGFEICASLFVEPNQKTADRNHTTDFSLHCNNCLFAKINFGTKQTAIGLRQFSLLWGIREVYSLELHFGIVDVCIAQWSIAQVGNNNIWAKTSPCI